MREVKPKCKQNRADQGRTQQLARDLSNPRAAEADRTFRHPGSNCLAAQAGYLGSTPTLKNRSETTQSRDVDNLWGVASVCNMKLCH